MSADGPAHRADPRTAPHRTSQKLGLIAELPEEEPGLTTATTTAPAAGSELRPRPVAPGVIARHLVAIVLLQSTLSAVSFILPVVAKKQFGADDFQTTLITAAPNILAVCSIFWSAVFARLTPGRYLTIYWCAALLPMALMALAQTYWHVAALAIVAAIGNAGFTPVAGDLLKKLYPDRSRGAIYGVLVAAVHGFGALAAWGVGHWLHAWPESFRAYMPLAAALQAVGCTLLFLLARSASAGQPIQAAPTRTRALSVGALLRPIFHMHEVLREDRVFARYEAAFMTYGVGWMICAALVPLIVTDRLKLPYDNTMEATHMAFLIAALVGTVPAGRLIDRLGAPRTCLWAFGLYALYPLGLIYAHGPWTLGLASVVYGLAASAVNMGWMLGPVALAPTPEKVPQYVAIHTTLVGLRGAVFMFAGVGIYKLSGSFNWPLVVAALAFAWAAWQMRTLERLIRERRRAASVS